MMKLNAITVTFALSVVGFAVVSKVIFDHVYNTSTSIIDEQFHIPQGLAYCKGNFSAWDPKITTLPGLYFISAILLKPFAVCSAYSLRVTNLFAAVVNLVLFVFITKEENKNKALTKFSLWSSINIALLPPLYFFSHVYYTDVWSVTSVLSMVLAYKRNQHCLASIFGCVAILIRQTNVVWIGMLLGNLLLDMFVMINRRKNRIKSRLKQPIANQPFYNFSDFRRACSIFLKRRFLDISVQDCINVFSYGSALFGFIVFIIMNGSIVVGDKSAHEASLHLPQIFYFSLFYIIFGSPFTIPKIRPFLKICIQRKYSIVCTLIAICLVIHFNTVVHPYLLADNRHYTFYIWSRFYGKYWICKYLVSFVYMFAIYSFCYDVYVNNNFGYFVTFLPCIIIPLIMQKMLELIMESMIYVIINILSFYVFFTKEIIWKDFEAVQRLIW